MFNLDDILKATGGRALYAGHNAQKKKMQILGISIDSRTIKKRELFVAIKGRRFDGHDFIDEAIKKGACGVVLELNPKEAMPALKNKGRIGVRVKDTLMALGDIAAYHRRRFNIPVIGITGSNGKTTVKEMISQILKRSYNVLKNRGTENNLIGLPLTLLNLTENHSVAVLEMGANHSGEIKRLAEILKPTVGLITNIGPSHLEFLKDKAGVLKVKSEMVHGLGRKDLLVLNGDDPMLSKIRPRCRRLTFGLKRNNDFRAANIKLNGHISFMLNNLHPFIINILGMHNLYNALAAIAVSSHFDIDLSAIRCALLDFRLPAMRMELKNINGLEVINDAYNSNPVSLKWAIQTLSDFKRKGRKILVTGDMLELGRRCRLFHSQAGRLAAESSIDALIAVGRFSGYTAVAANRAGMKWRNLWPCSSIQEAVDILKRIAKKGDTVLVKGSRGMAMEKIIDRLQ